MSSGLEAIFLEHRAMLLRFLRARGAADSAEDLLQDMWLKVSGRVDGPIADPVPYLYRMANNLMLDRYRSSTRRERREQDWNEGMTGAATGMMAERDPDPPADERIVAAQRLQQAQATLSALGPRVEQVFRKFRIEGVGQRDIAQQLGVSLTTVEKDLQKAYRAMMALRQQFDTEDR
ncbi:RNA polymerase sigma factor [Sphingobium sp. H39-3-25]|uniref:RNA polymerase sigma factor n=1 Tax=Sphingobium arseniciresistens TaxID=3030834 RepID=UPI0023B95637|nr:RNA polymerase sigma factor [Sphingobium arseniciresistens]